jgi:hypothetical protein
VRSDDISQDIRIKPPTGERDLGMRIGFVLSWDESTGENLVDIEGQTFENLNVVQGGIGIQYQPNDVVVVMRNKTTYFIWGKVAAPGAGAANQIRSSSIQTNESTSSVTYVDLATPGPQLTTTIGSSKRALVIFSAGISAQGNPVNAYVGGSASFAVSGKSSVATGTFSLSAMTYSQDASRTVGVSQTVTRSLLLTASDGLQSGESTFAMQYHTSTSGVTCFFNSRNITVIPF